MWTDSDEVLFLFLGQAGREHLDPKAFYLFGLGELLVDGVARALLRQSGQQPSRQRVPERAARMPPGMRPLGRLVLVVVLQSLDEARGRLRRRIQKPSRDWTRL